MMLTDQEIEKVAKPFLSGIFGFYLDEYGIRHDGTVIDFARAVIAANNAKVLAELKPDVHNLVSGKDCYSADLVSALIQERDSLEAKVKELEIAYKPFKDMIVAFNNNRELLKRLAASRS